MGYDENRWSILSCNIIIFKMIIRLAFIAVCIKYCSTGILQIAAPYLFPFVMEYSLLCISVAFVMYFSISEESRDNIEKGITNLFKIDVFEKDSSEEIEKDKLKSSKLDHRHPHGLSESEELFSKSHRGIYTGFMFLTGIIVCIVFFNFSYGNWDDPIKGETISLSCALSMAIILLLVAFSALVQMRVLSIINKPSSIDDYLLIIAMFGGLTYLLCIIMSGFNALNNGVYRSSTLETLRICMGFCSMAQLIVQVVLVISGLRQYPSKQSHVDLKPGRGSLTFLVIANVSAWIFHSVLTKTHDLQYSPTNLFNKVTWIILINITVPLLLFFYFHSSVCLADIWHQAYVPLQHNVHKPHGNQDHLNHASSHHDDLKADDVFSETLPSLKPLARTQPQQRSAISYLSPLIRSVSVSQLIQTRNISSNNFDDKSCNRSLSEIPQGKRTFPSPRDEDNYKDNAYNEYREYIHM
ncbi:hypothetical protein HELRODRAFT_168921 [Helobdella robusta]|uniref:Uncharacterized protein n=1 Tax=Helobdella robusta TaxID=6412 RepID=T1F148_HELRO|nr:hypothetical protein HELRODRAFT_168921 [Helobdella robusta]ESO08991.1 hypothetical protein HELRODRAFT_168921 [Helobdella robusta]